MSTIVSVPGAELLARTAFTRKARVAGEWTVVIRDGEHRVLARQTFTVT